jgi:hypothetical protein
MNASPLDTCSARSCFGSGEPNDRQRAGCPGNGGVEGRLLRIFVPLFGAGGSNEVNRVPRIDKDRVRLNIEHFRKSLQRQAIPSGKCLFSCSPRRKQNAKT